MDADLLAEAAPCRPPVIPAAELVRRHTALRPPLVHGLLRRGEIANVVAAPKSGKTWLAIALALAVQRGGEWLGFKCERGNVLYLDLELHPETLAYRIRTVAEAMDVKADGLLTISGRGMPSGIGDLEDRVEELQRLDLSLVVVDAWYRALPPDCDENANGDVMQVYNRLDALAADVGCAFCLVHHTTKGNQSQKSATDLGAGAGAQSRAADCHLGVRALKTPGAFGVSAVVRSWKPVPDFAIRRQHPLFVRDGSLCPTDYEGGKAKDVPETVPASIATEVLRHIADGAKPMREVVGWLGEEYRLSGRKAQTALDKAVASGKLRLGLIPGNGNTKFVFRADAER